MTSSWQPHSKPSVGWEGSEQKACQREENKTDRQLIVELKDCEEERAARRWVMVVPTDRRQHRTIRGPDIQEQLAQSSPGKSSTSRDAGVEFGLHEDTEKDVE